MLHKDILNTVHEFESSASGLAYIKSFSDTPPTDEEIDEYYNSGEAQNDSESLKVLESLRPEQLTKLVEDLKIINLDYKVSMGEHYEEEFGDRIDSVLNNL